MGVFFTFRETYWGLRHRSLRFARNTLQKPTDLYVKRYAGTGAVEARDEAGCLRECNVCGFCLIVVELDSGWQMEMCSALPVVDVRNAAFQQWAQGLGRSNTQPSAVIARRKAP